MLAMLLRLPWLGLWLWSVFVANFDLYETLTLD